MHTSLPEMSRRTFLHLIGSGAAVAMTGCRCQDEAGRSAAADLWSVWRSARDAVRASPDHLAARAARLAATRDADAIFAFVRDGIAAVPPQPGGFSNALTQTRFGVAAMLRCGYGTPREKAELLADLLRQAGLDAEIVQGRLDAGVATRDLLRPAQVFPFAPGAGGQQVDEWMNALGVGQLPPPANPDADGVASRQLADAVSAALPPRRPGRAFDWDIGALPFVRTTIDGREVILNPLIPQASANRSFVSGVMPALPAVPPQQLEVEILVASSNEPSKRRKVCAATWPIDRLIGRRIIARFVPAGDLASAMSLSARQLQVFTPVLTLEGPGIEAGAAPDCVVGDEVSLSGSVIRALDNGPVTVDDQPLGVAAAPVADSVVTVDMDVNALEFPLVRLLISPRDASGRAVEGVSGDALTVYEQDRPVQCLIRQSSPPPPRLLLLLDTSRSLPDSFRRSQAATFCADLHRGIVERYPGALMRVAAINYGVASASPGWASDPRQVQLDVSRLVGDGSEIWSALADAQQYFANVIVLVTDGQASDAPERIAAARKVIGVGPPIVAIGAGKVQQSTLDEIARATRGTTSTAARPDQATAAILDYLEARSEVPLHIEYRAPLEGPRERKVRVACGRAEGSGTYLVPEADKRLEGATLAGIYLAVRWRGRETLRTIAGIPAESATGPLASEVETTIPVQAALFGSAALSVEAGAPTLAAWLEDIFSARLSLEPLANATPGVPGLMAALMAGPWQLPSQLLALHAPLPTADDAVTFETGPRVVLLVDIPLLDGGVLSRADVLPTAGFMTAADDPATVFDTTLERSSRIVLAESALYQDTATARLKGRALGSLPAGTPALRSGPYAPYARVVDAWSSDDRLLPADEGLFAFWAVSPSGVLSGMAGKYGLGGSSVLVPKGCGTIADGATVFDLLSQAGLLPCGYGAAGIRITGTTNEVLRQAVVLPSSTGPGKDGSDCAAGAKSILCGWAGDSTKALFESAGAAATTERFLALTRGDGLLGCP